MVSTLVPADLLMLMLNAEVGDIFKTLFAELLQVVYVNNAAIGPLPKNALPTMLLWKGDSTMLTMDEHESQENSRKIFVIST
ncbi:MAG: hypothetical protein V2I33_21295 [Kangiellaceae bacterium]|jgi:hypothetical protein|nr:hypothetical protein [Kangiellaceae bacterium]